MADPTDPLAPVGTVEAYTPHGEGNAAGNAQQGVDLGAPGQNDVSDAAVTKLGDYLSDLTQKNYYSVDPPSSLPGTYYTKTTLGTNPPTDSENGAEAYTETNTPQGAESYFDTISGGSLPSADSGGALGNISSILDKSGQKKGHGLLKNIGGDGWTGTKIAVEAGGQSDNESAVRGVIQNSVLKYNRWNAIPNDSSYVEDQSYTHGMYSVQKEMGRYDPDATKATMTELKNVAINIMIGAAGAEGDKNSTPTNIITDVNALPVQIGLNQVDFINMTAGEQAATSGGLKALYRGGHYGNTDWLDPDVDNSKHNKSWGTLNNPLIPYGGPMPIAMLVIANIAVMASFVVGLIIGLIFDLLSFLGIGKDSDDQLPMGRSAGNPDFGESSFSYMVASFLRMPQLKNAESYAVSSLYGQGAFYEGLGDAVSTGYYLMVLRNAIRDTDQIEEAGKAMGSMGADPIAMAAGIFLVIEAFQTSATYNFILTMILLGDTVFAAGSDQEGYINSPEPNARNSDADDATLANLHSKNRLDSSSRKLAWRNASLPAAILLPTNLRTSGMPVPASLYDKQAKAYPSQGEAKDEESFDNATKPRYNKLRPIDNRLSMGEVRWIEAQLNSTYMPFYFHDLRTNEIIAFQAFVESITDDFSPNWNEVGGFGRMDPVQIYKNTTRSIGVTFWVAALDRADFEDMWLRINKLVTLVYPQWSQGLIRQAPGADIQPTFIQPFSQTPTASPVIRFRLGDLFRTNYTKKNLKRLFGDGTDALSFQGVIPSEAKGETVAAMGQDYADALEKMPFGPNGTESMALLNKNDAVGNAAALAMGLPATSENGPTHNFTYELSAESYPIMHEKAPGVWSRAKHVFTKHRLWKKAIMSGNAAGWKIVGYAINPSIMKSPTGSQRKAKRLERAAVKLIMSCNDENMFKDKDGKPYCVMVAQSDLTGFHKSSTIMKMYMAALSGPPGPFGATDPLTDWGASDDELAFFKGSVPDSSTGKFTTDADANPIVTSFESAMGMGLAGVISQLSMDWNDKTWETEDGSRAPQQCKITLAFKPIHDIPPGLDHQGGMRAPVYPVGTNLGQMFGPTPYNLENPDDIEFKKQLEAYEDTIEGVIKESWFKRTFGKGD